MHKLHGVIRDGYQGDLAPVEREQFRTDSNLDKDLSLIPINFFLHNRKGKMSVDELVFQAIKHPHSARFDRLALFAFHLNRVGSGTRVTGRPAWANEFVREKLWKNGVWQKASLSEESLDSFLETRMRAKLDVRTKCRTNYRHLFVLCGYLPAPLPVINSHEEQWIGPALFLAWDRHILDDGKGDKKTLRSLIDKEGIYKLLGVTREYAKAQADDFVDLYESLGCLERFSQAEAEPDSEPSLQLDPPPGAVQEKDLKWLEQEASDKAIGRRQVERLEQKRDSRNAAALKQRYDNTCQFCETPLRIEKDRFYSEAAHIKPVGRDHNGPDKPSNMLVLCPNHHLQFDWGALRLHKVDGGYRIKSIIPDDPLHGKEITLKHPLDDDCVKYHHDWLGVDS